MNIEKVAVIGAGTMGSGIAHTFAQHGYETYLYDLNTTILDKAISIISSNLDKQINKEIITGIQKSQILNRIIKINKIDLIPDDTYLIIEAIVEHKDDKLNLFKELHKITNHDCIFASNTSSISITEMAAVCRPEKFIGMHFMNPVPVMKLVEIIRGFYTSDDTFEIVKQICTTLEKESVTVNDYPGFISNRVLLPMINEAIFALYEGVAKAEDIDKVMTLGMNHPMGPLTLADFIGLDVCLNIMEVLYDGYKDNKYRPCPLLKKMVIAGRLGKKSGKGFFEYN
jgi:3-hydroxybutyryl-CoA dehydrogenase